MSSGKYTCATCTEVYDYVDDFRCHIMKRHMRWFPYECNICKDFMAVSKMEIYMHLASAHEEQVVTYTCNGAMETELNRQIELGLKGTQNMSNCSSGVVTENNTASPASSGNTDDYSRNLRDENIADAEFEEDDIDISTLNIPPSMQQASNELQVPSPNIDDTGDTTSTNIIDFIGLNSPKFNCDAIFNICCLYGDVMQIQFLTKNKCAVEMRDESGADNCIKFLNNLQVFDSAITIMKSRLKKLVGDKKFILEDGTDSFENYEQSKYHRFTPSFAAKNKLCPPNRFLFMWNMPSDMTSLRLTQELKKLGVTTHTNIRFHIDRNTNLQTGRGVLTFGSRKDATEALILINNKVTINGTYAAKFSFSCFSTPTPNQWPQAQMLSHLADPPMGRVQPRMRNDSNASSQAYWK